MNHASGNQLKSEPLSTAARWLHGTCDLALLAILFVAPLFMGGRHPVGRFVFVVLAVVLATAWLARQIFSTGRRWRWSVEWLLLAGLALLVMQLITLPTAAVATLAPDLHNILVSWTDQSATLIGFTPWSRVSLAPTETRGAAVLFVAYALMFVITVQRIESLKDAENILKWIALAAIAMASLGIVQYLTSNGKFLWVYEHPFRTVRGVQGSFINRNHFAHLLALGLGPLGFWLVTAWRNRAQQPARGFAAAVADSDRLRHLPIVLTIGAGIVLFAGLTSLSRGGAVAIGTSLFVMALIHYGGGLIDKKYVWTAAGVGILLIASLFIHGYDQVSDRLDDFAAGSLDQLDRHSARMNLWKANWLAFTKSPWLGHGVASHREFYPIFMQNRLDVEFTHAENGYLQVASETGLAGLLLLLVGIGLCVYWCIQGLRHTNSPTCLAALAAVSASLAASIVHSIADFVWFIPATISWTVILAAVAFRLHQLARGDATHERASALPPIFWMGSTAVVLVLGSWMISDRLPSALASRHWDSYLKKSRQLTQWEENESNRLLAGKEPSDRTYRARMIEQMTADLENYVQRNPEYPRAHVRLAATYLRQFQHAQQHADNPMDLAQIRDAAIASQFPSREALVEWLDRAIGPQRQLLDKALWHARRGIQMCPLQGEGYLYLAELCFLEGAPDTAKTAYVRQALAVRPHEGFVLFMAGKEAVVAGDLTKAVEYWKRSYDTGPRQQQQLVALLAGRVPLAFVLENFQPKTKDWFPLFMHYRQLNNAAELQQLCEYFVEQAENEGATTAPETARLWLAMHHAYRQLDDLTAAQNAIDKAHQCEPYDYTIRLTLAGTLLQTQQYAAAEKHLKWCLQQRPADKKVQQLRKLAIRGTLANHHRLSRTGRTEQNHPR